MYYWLFNIEETTPILSINLDDIRLFQKGEIIDSTDFNEIKVHFDIESFKNEDIVGEYFLTDYFPLISQRLANVLTENNIENYQLFDAKLLAKDGSESKRKFYILNLTANYELKTMKDYDPQCKYHIFRNPKSFEYVTISEEFKQILKDARGDQPWYIYTTTRYDFEWFKKNHFGLLSEIYDELNDCYEEAPLGEPFDQQRIKRFLKIVEKLNPYDEHLPNSGGGLPNFKILKTQKKEFKDRFLNKPEDSASYWLAQEIKMTVFSIHNYMETMCLE